MNNLEKKIAIIIATYNGEKFLSEQVKSIIEQKKDNIGYSTKILIRDDGSDDSTINIINRLKSEFNNISLVTDSDKQIGSKMSFFRLLRHTSDFDYVFFCDQDDIWPPDKICKYLRVLEEYNSNKCLALFSNAWIANADGASTSKKISELHNWQAEDKVDYKFLSMDYRVTGATLCINKTANKLIERIPNEWYSKAYMHDSFIALVISVYGTLILVNEPLLYYRQHENNVVGIRTSHGIMSKLRYRQRRLQHLLGDDILVYKLLQNIDSFTVEDIVIKKEYFKIFNSLKSASSFGKKIAIINKLFKFQPKTKSKLVDKIIMSFMTI